MASYSFRCARSMIISSTVPLSRPSAAIARAVGRTSPEGSDDDEVRSLSLSLSLRP